MATSKETVAFVLDRLDDPRFSARAMFGEYTFYADGKPVGLICDNILYVKILPASQALEETCEKDPPYPNAKEHYVVDESWLSTRDDVERLSQILFKVAEALPEKKKKVKKRKKE